MEERDERERERWPEEPETFEDEEIEDADERGVSQGRFRIFLLGVFVLAAVGVALFYARSWWSRPPAPPPRVVKSEPSAPPAPSAPAQAPKAGIPSLAALPPAPAEPIATAPPAPTKGEFWVQVGAFAHPQNAQRLGDRLTAERYTVTIRPSESRPGLALVQVGAYPDRRQAEAARAELESKGLAAFVLRRKPG